MPRASFAIPIALLAALLSCPTARADDGFTPLLTNSSFEGWEGPLESFRFEDGAVVGGTLEKPIPKNQFLSTKKSYADFELRVEFRLVGENVNAGVQIRSRRIPDHHEMIGYQADLGQSYWGFLYDESRRRRFLAQADVDALNEVLDRDGWNEYRIRCEGPRIRLWINDLLTADWTETDPSVELEGAIALQIHSGPPSEAWYRNVRVRELEPRRPALPVGVRGVVPRAKGTVMIDGDLSEFEHAFTTPLEYFHDKLRDRAAQFAYLWDDEAFYACLRTLDSKPANLAPDDRLWEGDGVEWYFDTRRGESFRSREWGPGAVHCYWVGLRKNDVVPRFCLRPGYLDAIPKTGVEVAAKRTAVGMDVEFKLPWVNFPEFKARVGEIIGLDAELCYSDGGPRVDRSFVFGSPLSVQQPANLARVQLVEKILPEHIAASAAVLAPVRCDTEWAQPTKPRVTARMALPPTRGSMTPWVASCSVWSTRAGRRSASTRGRSKSSRSTAAFAERRRRGPRI